MTVHHRHPHDFRYDRGRQGQGIISNQIHPASALESVQQVVGESSDSLSFLFDNAGYESLADESPKTRMTGWIQVEQVAFPRLEQPAEHPGQQLAEPGLARGLFRGQGIRPVLDEAIVLQNDGHVVVARDEPGCVPGRQGHAADRRVGAQPCVVGVRVRLEFRTGEVYRDLPRRPAHPVQT